jgi:hypothetical protein
MRFEVQVPLEFRGHLHKQDDIIELADDADPGEIKELEMRAKGGWGRFLDFPVRHTADMQAEPAGRGYKRR